MRLISLGVACALAIFLPSSLHAQWSPSATVNLGMGYGQMALSQAALNGARQLSKSSEKSFDRPARPKPIEPKFTPTFKADPKVTNTVNHRFIRFYGGEDPKNQQVMAHEVESGTYHNHFRGLMRRLGLEPRLNDLLEVSTARYVILWEIIHGRKASVQEAHAVRSQLQAQFADDFWMKRMKDAEKQELAETFVLHVANADLAHSELRRRDDKPLLANYRAGVQKHLVPDGPRLDRLTITDAGFVRRQ